MACYTEITYNYSFDIPSTTINGDYKRVYESESEARAATYSHNLVNVEGPVHWKHGATEGYIDPNALDSDINLTEFIKENNQFKALINGKEAPTDPPPGTKTGKISGTWNLFVCGGAVEQIWYFGCDKKGYFTNPDCNGICGDLIFPFSYSDDGTSVSVFYTAPPVVNCTGYPPMTPPTPKNDTFTYTIEGETLTVTQGTRTIVFDKKSGC